MSAAAAESAEAAPAQSAVPKKSGYFANLFAGWGNKSKNSEVQKAEVKPSSMIAEEEDQPYNRNCSDIEMDADDLSGDLGLSDDSDGEEKRAVYKVAKS